MEANVQRVFGFRYHIFRPVLIGSYLNVRNFLILVHKKMKGAIILKDEVSSA